MQMQTISELEVSLQAALEALRDVSLAPEITPAREMLIPDGLSPVVELVSENGRRKRSTAAAWNWNPHSDRIMISFRPIASDISGNNKSSSSPSSQGSGKTDYLNRDEIIECCQALADAERTNRQFIALKWFRDDFLPTKPFSWVNSPERRQRVLADAIAEGKIETKKIPNPKAPQFPTTTLQLNRSIPTPGVAPRFQPVAIRGESASATLLRDRGTI